MVPTTKPLMNLLPKNISFVVATNSIVTATKDMAMAPINVYLRPIQSAICAAAKQPTMLLRSMG